MGIEKCKGICCFCLIVVAVLLGLCCGFYWAFLALNAGTSDPGLIALYCISAICLIIICIFGILAALNKCYPIFMMMWLIGMLLLIAVIIAQIILQSTYTCTSSGTINSVWCGSTFYQPLTWAALGITLGLAVLGVIFAAFLFKIFYDDENGTTGSSEKGGKGGKNDFVY